MKYMIREIFTCQRGKVPEYLESLKTIIGFMRSQGLTTHKVYADIAAPMDTVFHEYEVDSLDEYFTSERGFFVDMDESARQLVDQINAVTVSGRREIYEVLDI